MSLEAHAVTVRLSGRVILDAASCQAERGRITAVIGPNGAGKSTLLRAMAGLLPLESGSIDIDGRALAAFARSELARELAYLPQERAVHWPLVARAIVALGRLPHRTGPRGNDAAAIKAAMHAMDVSAFADRPMAQLSGGERARVLVARALAQESRILVADEPTAGLDPAHALELFATFRRLAAQGRGVIVALHDLTLAARFCHHVVLLAGGRVAAAGPASAILAPAPLSQAFGVDMVCGTFEGVPIVLPIAPLR